MKSKRDMDFPRWYDVKFHLEFNIHDVWIGCYWKTVWDDNGFIYQRVGRQEIYICLIPCVVIHLTTFL